jgi:dTDP-4-amino-4,6-dideoxygalactose transaminase
VRDFQFFVFSDSSISSNWRMSDIAAAAICDHLERVIAEDWISKSEKLCKFALEKLEDVGLQICPSVKFPTIVASLFITLHKDVDPDELCVILNKQKPRIEAKHYYRPLAPPNKAPVAWKVYNNVVSLPLHLGLSSAMIEYMIKRLVDAIEFLAKSNQSGARQSDESRLGAKTGGARAGSCAGSKSGDSGGDTGTTMVIRE